MLNRSSNSSSPKALCARFTHCLILLFLVAAGLGIHATARAQQVVDQILALVNDEVVTKSDLLWSIALDPDAPNPAGPIGSDMLRRKLETMIDERLVLQEARKVPGPETSQDDLDKKRNELIARFPSETAFRERIQSVGLTPERLDDLLRQRIRIDQFVDFRFRSFVFVTDQQIKQYYEKELAPKIREQGQVPPGLEEGDIRDRIEQILRQQKINEEIDTFLRDARQRADVVILAEP